MAQKSKDRAVLEMLECCEGNLETAFDRAEQSKPCPIGSDSSCCKMCFMGPCRLVGKTTRGVCGATRATVAARNLARAVAAGASAHSDHGRGLALTLKAVAKGEVQGYRIRDVQKLHVVAGYLGIPTQGRQVNEIALDVANKVLGNFGQQEGAVSYTSRATPKRQMLWKDLELTPRGIDREVVEMMHRTHMGTDQDAESILDQAMRTALGDGWGGSMMATDISDILFGTPSPLQSKINLGVLKQDEVNIIVHGHEPTLSELIVAASTDPELLAYAASKGAKGINLAGICCTANEILMRHGIPPAGNFLSQELAIATGAIELMVVDVQCIMQAVVQAAKNYHTDVVTTSTKARIEGARHIQFDEQYAYDCAKRIVRTAIDNYPNRGKTHIPQISEELVAGFSHEYIGYMQGGLHRSSFRPLNDAVIAGRIRGLAAVVGCNNARVPQDDATNKIVGELIKNDVLVVVTGCSATAAAKDGYLRPEFMAQAGAGLREVCEAIGIPPVVHVGSCVDNSRILTILTQVATEGGLGEDIPDIPAVGVCPEYMSEKAVCIGTYCAASGAHVLFGVHNPVAGSPEVIKLMTEGWEKKTGGWLEWEPDTDQLIAKALGHIDAKRATLGLAAYDPTRYGQSGDRDMEKMLGTQRALGIGEEDLLGVYSALSATAEAAGK
jgi:carbon-monoxide dehydrogenase catalytic subunit